MPTPHPRPHDPTPLPQSNDRRTFLRSTLATLALGAAGTGLDSSAADPARRRIKIGFLGASHSHGSEKIKLAATSPDFELIGVAEENEAVRQRYEGAGVKFRPPKEVVEGAELVAVESDVRDHARHARMALEAGKHVHLEKPPADTLEGFRGLVELAKEKKALLQMGYMWRFHPGINAILEAARQGWLGEVFLVRGTINTIVATDRRPEWAEFRGGTLFELGSHLIDPVVRLLGQPEKITSFLGSHGAPNDGLADNCATVFEFAKATAIVSSATLQPNAHAHRSFEVQGTNGTAIVNPIEPPKLRVDLARAAGPYKAGPHNVEMPAYRRYAPEFAELVDCIRSGKPLSVSLEEDLLVQEALIRACKMKL